MSRPILVTRRDDQPQRRSGVIAASPRPASLVLAPLFPLLARGGWQ